MDTTSKTQIRTEQGTTIKKPVISVILEGYNETRDLGIVQETMEALRQQDFPLNQVEVILVGSSTQSQEWEKLYSSDTDFCSIKTVEFDDAHYYQLKNGGAQIALGEILAFTDSDVQPKPTWLSSIVEGIRNGADVVVGPSLFRQKGPLTPATPLIPVVSSITWGWIISKGENGQPKAVGFMDHNVALRADVFRDYQYRTDLGRVCASPLLYRTLTKAGIKVTLQSKQQATHYFSWVYWLRLHFRYGYEVFHLRRLDKQYPNQWIAQTKVLEPLVTMIWHILLDIPRWFRFSSVLQTHLSYRWAVLPIVIALSTIARAVEMFGIYATMLAPISMKQWAENF